MYVMLNKSGIYESTSQTLATRPLTSSPALTFADAFAVRLGQPPEPEHR